MACHNFITASDGDKPSLSPLNKRKRKAPKLQNVYSKKFIKPDSLKMGQEGHLSGEVAPRESLLMFVNHHVCFGDYYDF